MRYFAHLRHMRRQCKSQAFVEFAFILPLLLVFMCAIFDYSFMIMRMQVMAMAAREAANTATRQNPASPCRWARTPAIPRRVRPGWISRPPRVD